jgi:hypothetical protein
MIENRDQSGTSEKISNTDEPPAKTSGNERGDIITEPTDIKRNSMNNSVPIQVIT